MPTRLAVLLMLIVSSAGAQDVVLFDVAPVAETDPVPSPGDAADDIAIWVHPSDKTKSVIVGTNKQHGGKGGLYVYGLDGKLISSVPGKRMNNVDMRYGFTLAGKKCDLFAATNRDDERADFFVIDPDSRKLTPVGSIALGKKSALSGFTDPYGIALAQDRKNGTFYVIVSDRYRLVAQFELAENEGRVAGKLVRLWDEKRTIEGMVADDVHGCVYLGAESGGIIRYATRPALASLPAKAGEPPADRRTIDTTGPAGHLAVDVEGLALYETTGGGGYLLASSQGNSRFVIYDRKTLAYLATFRIRPNEKKKIGGVTDTDGIDAVSGNLGPLFPLGAFIAQDGDNGDLHQNFKIVSWTDLIEKAAAEKVKITGDADFDPRKR
jgi:3-phytase